MIRVDLRTPETYRTLSITRHELIWLVDITFLVFKLGGVTAEYTNYVET